jgi:TonB family protein
VWRLEPIPQALRSSPLGTIDRLLGRSLTASVLVCLLLVIALNLVPERSSDYESLEALPERLARLIIEPPAERAATSAPASPRPAPIEEREATPPREAPAESRRVRDLLASSPPAPRAPPSPEETTRSGRLGRERAEVVASAVQAGNMLSGIDALVDGLRGVAPTPAGGRGSRDRAAIDPGAQAAARAKTLSTAAGGETGNEAIAAATSSAGSRIGSAPLSRAAVRVEELATVGTPGSAGGGGSSSQRSSQSLMTVVHRYAGGIKYCYDQLLAVKPGLRGRMVLLITVAPSGAVSRVRVVGNTVKNAGLEDCVLGQVKSWKFPAGAAEPVSFSCPLVFAPPEG